MDQKFGFCKGCGKMILWTKTPAGKAMPCDPEVIRFEPAGRAETPRIPETFVTPEGEVKRGVRETGGSMVGYISHFATCRKVEDFSR